MKGLLHLNVGDQAALTSILLGALVFSHQVCPFHSRSCPGPGRGILHLVLLKARPVTA